MSTIASGIRAKNRNMTNRYSVPLLLGARTLLGTSASLVVTSALLVVTKKLLGAKGLTTRSKDATRGTPGRTTSETRNKKLLGWRHSPVLDGWRGNEPETGHDGP